MIGAVIEPIVVRRIVELLRPTPSDTLVQVGARSGELTAALLQSPVHYLIAVEPDRNYAPRLLALLQQHPHRLSVVFGDALRSLRAEPHNKLVLLGNAAQVREVCSHLVASPVERAVFVLDPESQRVLSESGVPSRYVVERGGVVPRSAFSPAAPSDAVLLTLTRQGVTTKEE